VLGAFEVDDERAVEQRRLPLPQARERVALGARYGDVRRAHPVQAQPEVAAHDGRQRALASACVAAQLHDCPRPPVVAAARQLLDDALGVRAVGEGQGARRADRLDEAPQALVERRGSHQVVQHALVHAQPPRHQRLAREQLDEVPAAQRARGREGAPVSAGQGGVREAEGREGAARIAARGGAERREALVQLRPDGEEERVTLELREAEVLAQARERSRDLGRGGGLRQSFIQARRRFVSASVGFGGAFERVAHARQRRQHVAAVGLLPSHCLFAQRCHVISTSGPWKRPSGATSSWLSAPSTWTRTR
jgi:hypothetical protein